MAGHEVRGHEFSETGKFFIRGPEIGIGFVVWGTNIEVFLLPSVSMSSCFRVIISWSRGGGTFSSVSFLPRSIFVFSRSLADVSVPKAPHPL
jgi:hypothetical protein